MTGAHPDDAKPKISIVDDKKMRLVERMSLLDYDVLVELIGLYYNLCVCIEPSVCEICQFAIDFELV